ncbi:MAG: hypothetical protein IJO43_05015 [Bacilli bacterium]|nr:hypothetical protein [Bacilli bacterium]
MNNKGWGLAEMLILCSILVVSLLLASFYIRSLGRSIKGQNEHNNTTVNVEHSNKEENNTNSNNNEVYTRIENKIELLSQRYIYNMYNNQIDETTIIVDMQHLLEQDNEKELDDMVDNYSCKGYSKVYKVETIIYYDSYIDCDEYTTTGFESFYVE